MSDMRWIVVPAAGVGERMGGTTPKQYLNLNGRSVLEVTLERLLSVPSVEGIVVVLAADDARWLQVGVGRDPRIHQAMGGDTRASSVLSGLRVVMEHAAADTWVLVHDAARPLIHVSDVQRLTDAVCNSGAVGGILATPVHDTLKKADEYCCIERTVSRQNLWQAQTPQMFRVGQLHEALNSNGQVMPPSSVEVTSRRALLTDEASAMEAMGHDPLLVEALRPNIKITRPVDLDIAKALLRNETEVA